MKKITAIIIAMLVIVASSVSVWAQASEPGPNAILGGRIMTDLGVQRLSKELTINKSDDVTTAFLSLNGSSYLRGTWTSADKKTGGVIEMRAASYANDAEAVALAYAYGWWKVGNCQIVAGQIDGWLGSLAYAPIQSTGNTPVSGKSGLVNWGFIYSGRAPQVRFEWQSGKLGFSIAAVQPAAEIIPHIDVEADVFGKAPRFDVAFEFKAGGFMTTPAFGWSQVNFNALQWYDSYHTWLAILPFKITTGPFTAKLQLHTGVNTEAEYAGELINGIGRLPKIIPIWSESGKEFETTEQGGAVSLEYRVGALTLAAGYGQVKIANDLWSKLRSHYKKEDYSRQSFFLAAPYAVTKTFIIQPEYSYYNYGDSITTGKDTGNEWIFGLQFRFLF